MKFPELKKGQITIYEKLVVEVFIFCYSSDKMVTLPYMRLKHMTIWKYFISL